MKRPAILARFLPRSLGGRMTLAMAGLFATGLLAFGGMALNHLQASKRQAADYQMTLTQRIADDLDARLEAAMASLEAMASQLPDGLPADPGVARHWIAERAGPPTVHFGHGLFLLRGDGVSAAMSSDQPQLADLPEFRMWALKSVVIDETIVSPPFEATLAMDEGTRKTRVLLMATPLAGGGVLAGVMNPGRSGPLATLIDARAGESDSFYVMDGAGRFLLGSPEWETSRGHVPPDIVNLARHGVREASATTAGGDEVLATLTKLQTTGWVLGIHVPLDKAYAEARNLGAGLLAFLLLCALAAAGAAWGMTRLFAQPIRALTDDVVRLGNTDGPLRPLPDRGGVVEVILLTSTINALIARIDDDMTRSGTD